MRIGIRIDSILGIKKKNCKDFGQVTKRMPQFSLVCAEKGRQVITPLKWPGPRNILSHGLDTVNRRVCQAYKQPQKQDEVLRNEQLPFLSNDNIH